MNSLKINRFTVTKITGPEAPIQLKLKVQVPIMKPEVIEKRERLLKLTVCPTIIEENGY